MKSEHLELLILCFDPRGFQKARVLFFPFPAKGSQRTSYHLEECRLRSNLGVHMIAVMTAVCRARIIYRFGNCCDM